MQGRGLAGEEWGGLAPAGGHSATQPLCLLTQKFWEVPVWENIPPGGRVIKERNRGFAEVCVMGPLPSTYPQLECQDSGRSVSRVGCWAGGCT